jgi:hypothetical protein
MSVHRLLAPALALVAASACQCDAVPTSVVGTWDFSWTVEEAEGACAGEVGEVSTGTITIEAGTGDVDFVLVGFGTAEDVALDGTFADGTLTYDGSYPDDDGTTTSSTTLSVSDDFDTLDGTETWSWETEGNPGACPSATSSVHAERSNG